MKTNKGRLFSLSVVDSDYFNNQQNKIELVSCPRKVMKCKEYLSIINKSYIESEQFRREKDFQRSIETLKSAFYITLDLKEPSCSKCAKIFRSTITESLENIHFELEKMSTGIFRNKRYQASYLKADIVLKEFENLGPYNMFQLDESKNQFLGNYLKKRASI